jgi:hypothetical protein
MNKSFKLFLEADVKNSLKIADEVVAMLKNKPEGHHVRSSDIDKAEMNGPKAMAALRNWGDWETPSDAHDEDEEDYDWQELSDSSYKKLKAYVEEFQKKYPEVKITYGSGEKNWIYIYVK